MSLYRRGCAAQQPYSSFSNVVGISLWISFIKCVYVHCLWVASWIARSKKDVKLILLFIFLRFLRFYHECICIYSFTNNGKGKYRNKFYINIEINIF